MPNPDLQSPRLFVDAPLASGAAIPLGRDQSNYVFNVLRLGPPDTLLLFNGRDGEWRADVGPAGKRSGILHVVEQLRPQPGPSGITYAFAPLKHARLDYMVQKAVEMGVGVLQPVLTRRTQVTRINQGRMRANVVEAAEQCGVLAVPEVHEPLRFDAWLETWPADRSLVFCDEDAPVSDPLAALRDIDAGRTALVIGPEGGFHPLEREALMSRIQVRRISLGPRILRADTAAVAALAIVQASAGDWR